MEQSRVAAQRLLAEPAANDNERLELSFRRTLGRTPTAEEREIAVRTIREGESVGAGEAAWTELFHALFASVDFRYRD